MDADISVPLRYVPVLIDRVRAGSDVAIASRWMFGARIPVPQPPLRRLLGRLYYRLIHFLFLPEVHDCNCGLKAYRGDVARVLYGYVRSWRWAFNMEHLWVARRLGFVIEEIPVEWSHNAASKVHIWRDGVFTLTELAILAMRRLMDGYPISGGD
jgi:dolichyl-phosphate beta-glucosyltransferase